MWIPFINILAYTLLTAVIIFRELSSTFANLKLFYQTHCQTQLKFENYLLNKNLSLEQFNYYWNIKVSFSS